MDGAGAAADLEAARQRAVGGEAAVDAGVHHRPDPVEAGVESAAVAAGGLVGALHRGDREAGGLAHGEHLGGGGEGIGAADLRVVALEGRALQLALGQDEAAADRVVGLGAGAGCRRRRRRGAPCRWRGRGAAGRSRRPRPSPGRRRAAPTPGTSMRPVAREVGQAALGLVGVEGVGDEAEQAEDHRAVGGVALAGEGEAAVQRRLEPGRRRRSPGCGRRRRAARRGSGRRRASGPWCASDDGPTPILKMSKTLRNMAASRVCDARELLARDSR